MKKIVFLTGTRADFGKLKSLMKISQKSPDFDVYIFATGMHLDPKHGLTVNEIRKSNFKNIFTYKNYKNPSNMDINLARTIQGFSKFITSLNPDLIVIHGDRLEALAGAIVGSFNNLLVAHVEGGEISGTIDELIRHSVSKLSHIHLVSNDKAKARLIQMGELENSIYVIGSPDLDLMNPDSLPDLKTVKKYYGINYNDFAIAMYHPVTTEYHNTKEQVAIFVDTLIESNKNYIVIYPNNDLGSDEILAEYKRLENNSKFKIFPSLRFEYFLRLLKETDFVIGNSSAGIREAPYYKVPTIDIGSRQKNRAKGKSIFNVTYDKTEILKAIESCKTISLDKISISEFGNGNSDSLFLDLLKSEHIWKTQHQKQFQDIQL